MHADLAAEAVRLHQRYLVEIVEALGFCPWAKRARLDGHTRQLASMATTLDEAMHETQAAISEWTPDARIEVGFMIFPRLGATRRAFDELATRIGEREAQRHAIGEVPFVMASFHPDAQPDTRTGERFISFLRRTPDPCLQLVRCTVLESVRENTPQGTRMVDLEEVLRGITKLARDEVPLRERIARQNLATAQKMGIEELQKKLDDIRADRDRTYSALLGGES